MAHDDDDHPRLPMRNMAVNTRIMVAAVVVLFVVVVFILFLHIYARWFWRSARLRAIARDGGGGRGSWARRFGRRRRMRFSFRSIEPAMATGAAVVPSKGLDKAVLESLPIFFYRRGVNGAVKGSTDEEEEILDCAVCLSEFEENEAGRRLPKCGHVFHTECIDMWFSSHSTCPLCRTSVGTDGDENGDLVVVVERNHSGIQGEQLLRETVVLGLAAGSTNASVPPSTGEAVRILQNEGSSLLEEPQGPSSSSSTGLKSPQQQHFPASVLFWGNRSYTNSNSSSSLVESSSRQQEHQETTVIATGTGTSSSLSRKQRSPDLIIEVPRRSAANFSSACPSPNSAEGGGQRSPLGAHIRNIKRLLSRDSRRISFDTSPSPVGRDCCDGLSASHTPGSITPTSQC